MHINSMTKIFGQQQTNKPVAKVQQQEIVAARIRAREAAFKALGDDAPSIAKQHKDPVLAKMDVAREITAQERASVVFGSRLAGPERRKALESTYRDLLGVKVPPRPTEPDNCCMSGCVNCVWELYREDFEFWQEKRKQAMDLLVASKRFDLWPEDFGPNPIQKVSGTTNDLKAAAHSSLQTNNDPWKGVDLGIRIFIETEKKLREKKKLRAAAAAAATTTVAAQSPPAQSVGASA
ncbi:oxidoreductase-like protein [Lipomyces oligophaga]|uniref:oxidoreductase-like protein n=1 Tax=Lipomyces oligophaga TaxID=45792 RepID=UPI0034CD0980